MQKIIHDPAALPVIMGHEEATFEIVGGSSRAGLVLLCDHGGNAFPPGYGTLGLPASELERHIAYDIGAAAVTRALAGALGCPALVTRYSRLLIDLNRGADDPTLIMRLSDGAIVPGNRHVDAAEREKRIALFYRPYHDAITRVLDVCLATGRPPAILSLHSFTPVWKGSARPWHAAVLWDVDGRMARPLIEALRAEPRFTIGDNEPYSGALEGDTMWQHGTQRGLPHALIEIRQDLIASAGGQAEWVVRLARILRDLSRHPDLDLHLNAGAGSG